MIDDAAPEPRGVRGWSPAVAAKRMEPNPCRTYARRADLWPLDPEGELLLVVQIETRQGIENLAEDRGGAGRRGHIHFEPGPLA